MPANAIVIDDEDERDLTRIRLSGLIVQAGRHWLAEPTMRFRDETRGTKRVMFAVAHNEPVGADQIITSLCRVPCCCHPAHLRLETMATAGLRRRRSHCLHGHPFNIANSVWIDAGRGRRRQCRACNRRRDAEYTARQRERREAVTT